MKPKAEWFRRHGFTNALWRLKEQDTARRRRLRKRYVGILDEETGDGMVAVVTNSRLGTYALPPRLDLRNHSPTGFAWGYGGSGPSQLALAMLADALGDDERALDLYMEFKLRVVGGLAQRQPFELSHETVMMVVDQIERDRNGGANV